MITVKAYYDGAAFVPVEPIDITKGKIVEITVFREEDADSEIAKRLSAFERITNNIREINGTDPLPHEFDAILATRVNFTGGLDL
jgi:predicted DNA-binding antitoxin AbrB/MazE fold protein